LQIYWKTGKILNHLTSCCQLNKKTLFLTLLILSLCSCAKRTVKIESQEPDKKWFDVSERYSFPDFEGEVVHHSFFDFDPKPSIDSKELYFVMTTPKGGAYGYQMNLMSGKLYRRFNYCKEEDVWGSGRQLNRPHVHIGIVPRLIDPTGRPQQVIVFGKKRYFHSFERTAVEAQKIRIVGGVLHQYCKQYPCQVRERWLSKVMLIAVNKSDPDFKNVKTMEQLKSQVDWQQTLDFLQNSFGRNVSLASKAPAYRVTGEVEADRAMKAAFEKGLLFTREQQLGMQLSCHALYNYFWFASERVRKNMQEQTSLPLEKVVLRKDDQWERKRIQSFVSETGKSLPPGAQNNFPLFLHHFVSQYGKSFETCSSYVRDSNININPPRHWFLAQVRSFFQLWHLDYAYVCSKEAWVPNPLIATGERVYDPQKQLRKCLPSQLDEAFDSALTLYAGLRSSYREHYRYIQYDSVKAGSHQKIYDWIYDNGKRLSCDKNEKQMANLPIFPEDVDWRDFTPGNIKNFLKVIR
jgi:hypothetical protein